VLTPAGNIKNKTTNINNHLQPTTIKPDKQSQFDLRWPHGGSLSGQFAE
jgi:hypothetical protein